MVFDPFQKEMYMAYVSKEEFESMSVYIPYDTILDVSKTHACVHAHRAA